MVGLKAKFYLWILTCSSSSEEDKFELEEERQIWSVERDDSLLDLKIVSSTPQFHCYLGYQRCLGWRRLSRYWRNAGDNGSSILWPKEVIREWLSTTSLPNDPSSNGRQQLCSPCLLILFCSSFWKKLHRASISDSSPKREPALLAANFPQPLPPFKGISKWFWHIPPPSSTSCKATRDTHGRNFTRGIWWDLATCRSESQGDTRIFTDLIQSFTNLKIWSTS